MKHKQIRNKLRSLGIAIGMAVSLGSVPAGHADTIYREIFGRPSGGSGGLDLNGWGWQAFTNNGLASHGIVGAGVSQAVGRPGAPGSGVPNINAGLNGDGSSIAYTNGYVFNVMAQGPILTITPEYTINPNDYVPGSLSFSWFQGNNNQTSQVRLALEVGGLWYASATGFTNINIGGFVAAGTGGELKTLTFDATAANWLSLNFDGTYDGNVTAVDSTLGALSLGGAPGSDLSGSITAFGLYAALGATVRFDTFEVNATPVPEPTTAALLGLGATGLVAAALRRKRQVR